MGNFTDAPIRREGEAVTYDDIGYIERFGKPIHMKAKGKWQILEWNTYSQKYRVVSEHPTRREAEAFKKLME